MGELTIGLARCFTFHNEERPHQFLGDQTPASVYRNGVGGGALVADKYGSAEPAALETA